MELTTFSNFVQAHFSLESGTKSKDLQLLRAASGLVCETKEYLDALSYGSKQDVISELGDMMVWLVRLTQILESDLEDCYIHDTKNIKPLSRAIEILDCCEKITRDWSLEGSSYLTYQVDTILENVNSIYYTYILEQPYLVSEILLDVHSKLLKRQFGKTVFLLHGYARSGKTTLEKSLREIGILSISTSDYLHYLTLDRFNISHKNKIILENKDDNSWFKLTNQTEYSCRDACIDTAENPDYGVAINDRKSFVNDSMEYLLDKDRSDLIFCTSFNTEESFYLRYLFLSKGYKFRAINIRSKDEIKDCDGRELHYNCDLDFWNAKLSTTHTLHDFYNALKEI